MASTTLSPPPSPRLPPAASPAALAASPARDPASPAVLVLDRLSVAAPSGALLVRDLSLALLPGQRLLVRGANGGGKTSLLRVPTGVWPAASGAVSRIPSPDDIAIATQRPYVPERLSLRQLLNYPGGVTDDEARSDSWLESIIVWCGLAHVLAKYGLDTPVGKLSGGETQRVAVARLRLNPPSLAILDEPTANVEVAFEAKLFGWLAESHMTVVTVGHRPELRQHHTHELTLGKDGKCSLRQL